MGEICLRVVAASPHATFARLPELRRLRGGEIWPGSVKTEFVIHVAAFAGARHRWLALARRGTGRSEIATAGVVGADLATAAAARGRAWSLRVEALQHHFGGVFVLRRTGPAICASAGPSI